MRIIWYPTFQCCNYNGSCPYCHEYSSKKYKKYLDWYESSINKSLSKNLISFFNKNRDVDINLTGGEPFFYNKRIIDVFSHIENRWSVNTNCQMTNNIVKSFEKMDISKCDGVCCSFHPLSNKGKEFVKTVDYFLRKGINPQINYVLSNHTLNRVHRDIVFLRNNLPQLSIHLIREISSLYDDVPEIIDDYPNVIKSFDKRLSVHLSKLSRTQKKNLHVIQNELKHLTPSRKCKYNREHVVLAPNGDLFPCSCFLYQNKKSMCNINKIRPNLLNDPQRVINCKESQCVLFHDQMKHI